MHHVLSMRLARDPRQKNQDATQPRADPVRRIVQGVLVLYLSPVILVVLMLSGIAIAGTHAAGIASRGTHWLLGRKTGPSQPVKGESPIWMSEDSQVPMV